MTNTPNYYDIEGSEDVYDLSRKLGASFPVANALKYIVRAGKKPGASYEEDIRKAHTSLGRELELISGEKATTFGESPERPRQLLPGQTRDGMVWEHEEAGRYANAVTGRTYPSYGVREKGAKKFSWSDISPVALDGDGDLRFKPFLCREVLVWQGDDDRRIITTLEDEESSYLGWKSVPFSDYRESYIESMAKFLRSYLGERGSTLVVDRVGNTWVWESSFGWWGNPKNLAQKLTATTLLERFSPVFIKESEQE